MGMKVMFMIGIIVTEIIEVDIEGIAVMKMAFHNVEIMPILWILTMSRHTACKKLAHKY